jgi:hypothetical protein
MEAVEENRIAFHLGMRDFEGYGAARPHIGGAENRGHAAAGSETVYPVVIELFPGVDGSLVSARSAESRPGEPSLWKPIGSPAVHCHTFDAANADQLQADIITTVPLIGNIHQLACGRR